MSIQLIPAAQIDRLKWDSCVHYATQPLFTGYTWFLNAVSKEWSGLVEGDYETVLPLFHGRDMLLRTVYRQPWHMAPGGPFSRHVMSRPRILSLLRALPPRTRKLLLAWEGNISLDGLHARKEKRYLLPLYDPYPALAEKFTPSVTSPEEPWAYIQPSPEEITAFWMQHAPDYKGKEKDRHRYHRIIYQAMHRGQWIPTAIKLPGSGILAAGGFVSGHGYVFRLLHAHTPDASGRAAMTELYRSMAESWSGRPVMLDFNGDTAGEAFGATLIHYTLIHKD